MGAPKRPFDLAAHIAEVVDRAPSWDELPTESREVLLRVFRGAAPVEPKRRSA